MTNVSWSYLQNPFDNVTKNSYKKMYEMSTDHFDKLRGYARTNLELKALYDWAYPAYQAFVQEYDKGYVHASTYQMQTATLENLLLELSSTHIRRWDVAIMSVYDIVEPPYKALLPEGRRPFQSGAYDARIRAVKRLADSLQNFPALSALQTTVLNTYCKRNPTSHRRRRPNELQTHGKTKTRLGYKNARCIWETYLFVFRRFVYGGSVL
jgi:hypothetical protein